jgi:hypothetical protein
MDSSRDTHSAYVYLHNQRTELVRGWVSWIKAGKGETMYAYLRSERFPGKEFRVTLSAKKKPFGNRRAVERWKVRELPVVTRPVDLSLAPGTRVLFGLPHYADEVVFPVISEKEYDAAMRRIDRRDTYTPQIKKGQHCWPDDI